MKFKKSFFSALLLCGMLLCTNQNCSAASDGASSTTSTGSANLSVTIPKLIRARGFTDFTPSIYSGTGTRSASGNINVSTNYGTAVRTYSIVATGSGASGAFTISDTFGNTLAYSAFYNQVTGITGRTTLTAGVALTGRTGAAKPLSDTTQNANLSINFTQANLQAAEAGNYSGTIAVVFSPE